MLTTVNYCKRGKKINLQIDFVRFVVMFSAEVILLDRIFVDLTCAASKMCFHTGLEKQQFGGWKLLKTQINTVCSLAGTIH